MSSRKWVSFLRCLTPMLLLLSAACSGGERDREDTWTGVCIDGDGDGHGLSCAAGSDCDDSDPAVQVDCRACDKPNEGCDCEQGTAPIECTPPPELTSTGSLICKEGTRYCRDGKWSGCEGIHSYVAPPPSELGVKFQSLLPPDASGSCNLPCNPDCYKAEDRLVGVDAGAGSAIVPTAGGGITLRYNSVDGGSGDGGLLDDYKNTCVPGNGYDSDCDGIPNVQDAADDEPPFATDHSTIFLELAPGQSGTSTFDTKFFVRTADIYFYIDMTRSMEEERDKLISSLTSGNYLPASFTEDCADRDLDGSADNWLKNQGVAGAIFCMIRDSSLGTGWFRDIPFRGPYDNGLNVAPSTFEMYENRQDITTNVQAVLDSLNGFQTAGNYNHAEGGMQGLWSIATGGEVYAGWDRPGIPSRVGCPTGTWGYPCFRDGAVPIIIHITDASMQNGPPTTLAKVGGVTVVQAGKLAHSATVTHPVNYDSDVLTGLHPGTGATYKHPTKSAESLNATAEDIGNVDNAFYTYVGNTEKMSSDLTYQLTGSCPSGTSAWDSSSQGAGDAVYKFKLDAPKTITISSRGTHFDSSLLLLKGPVANTVSLTATGNGTTAAAYDLGTLPSGQRTLVSGTTSGNGQVFAREGMEITGATGCFLNEEANDLAEGAVFKFRLAQDGNIRFTTSSSAHQTTALYASYPTPPTNLSLSGVDNDTSGVYSVGDLKGRYVHLSGGTTWSPIGADYADTGFESVGCSNMSSSDADAVVDFSLSSAATIRFETSGTSGSSEFTTGFTHGLALVQRAAAGSTVLKTATNNGTQATATEILESDVLAQPAGTWIKYQGDSTSDTPTYEQSDVGGNGSNVCHNNNVGGATADKDVVFKFKVNTTRTFEFETAPTDPATGYKTWLSLHKDVVDSTSTVAISNSSALDSAGGQAILTAAPDTIDYRRITLTGGQIDQRDRTVVPSTMGNNCGSTNNSSTGGRDAVFSFKLGGTASVRIRTVGSDGSGTPAFDSYLAVFKDSVSAANRVSPHCPSPTIWNWFANNQSGNGWDTTLNNLSAGTYYVVVKEWRFNTSLSANNGRFGLIVEDVRYADTFLECDAGSASDTRYSKITRQLSPATYYLVIKGSGSGANQKFSLNVRVPTTSVGTPIICKNDSSDRAVLEHTLNPGDYSVVIKGRNGERGSYNLTMRDVTAVPAPVACGNTARGTSSFSYNNMKASISGQPVDYYLVTRGNQSSGTYQIAIDETSTSLPTPLKCDNNGAPAVQTVPTGYSTDIEVNDDAQISMTNLAAGEYYVVLKGRTSSDKGWYQLSIGNNTGFSSASFAPKTWLGPAGDGVGGIRAELLAKGIRVITVNSAADPTLGYYLTQQAGVLSKDTLATYENGSPISLSINSDGSGIGTTVVSAISSLVGTLRMDLGLQLSAKPEYANPGFGFLAQAIVPTTNKCDSVVDRDKDALGIPDTHMGCGPGDVPRFKVTFTNPASGIPLNQADLAAGGQGGYTMRLELVDVTKKFVVDSIPVYIVPTQVAPPQPGFEQTGIYEQTVDALNCSGNEVPRWTALSWSATVPPNTKLTWKMCAGSTDQELASCSLRTAAVVTSGDTCTTNSQCSSSGYCDGSGRCHYVTGPSCSDSLECGNAGSCLASKCMWSSNPIDLLPTLGEAAQGKGKMRVQIVMDANADRSQAPTVTKWGLQYTCVSRL